MRLFVIIIIILGVLSVTISGKGGVLIAHAKNIFHFWNSEDNRFLEKTAERGGVLSVLEPVVAEDRGLATGFLPEQKEFSPRLSIVTAHASVIMDVDSGKVLYARNADERRQIASLTKLFTATIVMEQIKDLEELVTIDEEAIYSPGTRVGCPRSGFCNGERLKPGEKISARNLLKAALMNSANDAAIALGKHIGKTQDGFAKIMNQRAQELGLENSHFCTPSGLEPDGREHECYSSAADVARIATHALEFPELWEIMRIEKQFITSADGEYTHEIFNTDQLLGQFPNLVGTKTGFTPLAGYSLLAVATDYTENHRVVAVVLDDQSRWQSVRSMFDWSFQTFDWR
ncbi:MAG: D-alanyl-D-alanine carboxypeptidase family protein [Candidatus Moranbacteria bacterium]|nr:D-alanyl-D-alanine carboxypeptidase family protein [Candidatus Moranbacteria bacterium]